ncbi:MAG: hypothetical protein Ta2A_04860 [Treponemataceae bacterium]|nr:MAG: hypothetical protein Ta2A_04860 [Treponemataceae bacterium]
MTKTQWQSFAAFRERQKTQIAAWNAEFLSELMPLQKAACADDTPDYPIETPVVYNTSLDAVTEQSDPQLILVSDNPGKNEQLVKNQKYLIGMSGKIAENFFRTTSIDFRQQVIVLNKTPVHSAKTKHLNYIYAHGSAALKTLIKKSQVFMACECANLQKALALPLWITGYAELGHFSDAREKGIFCDFRKSLLAAYTDVSSGALASSWNNVRVFQHFSMNRFLIDLRAHNGNLDELGEKHRKAIFGA